MSVNKLNTRQHPVAQSHAQDRSILLLELRRSQSEPAHQVELCRRESLFAHWQ